MAQNHREDSVGENAPRTSVSRMNAPRTSASRMNAFDGFVLAGALVNVAVITLIVGYWVLYG